MNAGNQPPTKKSGFVMITKNLLTVFLKLLLKLAFVCEIEEK